MLAIGARASNRAECCVSSGLPASITSPHGHDLGGGTLAPMDAVYCADVGSIANNRFAWARGTPGHGVSEESGGGQEVNDLVEHVVADLDRGLLVALGFECPLFVPVPDEAARLGRGRPVDRDRPWSAGPGIAVPGVGLVQVPWVLASIRDRREQRTPTYLRWNPTAFERPGLFLWEAFVSGKAKGVDHSHDARIAVQTFLDADDEWVVGDLTRLDPV
jgi:hypothetical protein